MIKQRYNQLLQKVLPKKEKGNQDINNNLILTNPVKLLLVFSGIHIELCQIHHRCVTGYSKIANLLISSDLFINSVSSSVKDGLY